MKDQLSTYQGGKCLPRAMMNDLISIHLGVILLFQKKKKKASIFPLLHSMEKLSEVYINNTLNLEISQSRLKKKKNKKSTFWKPFSLLLMLTKLSVSK